MASDKIKATAQNVTATTEQGLTADSVKKYMQQHRHAGEVESPFREGVTLPVRIADHMYINAEFTSIIVEKLDQEVIPVIFSTMKDMLDSVAHFKDVVKNLKEELPKKIAGIVDDLFENRINDKISNISSRCTKSYEYAENRMQNSIVNLQKAIKELKEERLLMMASMAFLSSVTTLFLYLLVKKIYPLL